jgi:ABC-type transport system involved in multi-copper enzyme maturation permease subunit
LGLLHAKLFKLARCALLRWLGLVLLALVLLRGLVWPPAPEVPWAGLWSFTLVATALGILTAVTVGTEFSEDTFRSLISRGVPRAWSLLAKFAALMLVGGMLLVAIEGVATLLGIRPELHWGHLGRAWLSLWPYAGLIMLLTVLACNGGLALVVGVIWISLEQFAALMIGGMIMLAEFPDFRWMTHQGIAGTIYQWSLAYNSANWTYLSAYQQAPMPLNVLLWAMPHSAARSALVLAAYTLLGLGLSILIVYRRDVTEVVATKNRLFHVAKRHTRPKKRRAPPLPDIRMGWIDRAPLLVRLIRVHLFRSGRTSLVRIGLLVSLLFPLALWGLARALAASGFGDSLFGGGPEGSPPLAIVFSLMVVGPLAPSSPS